VIIVFDLDGTLIDSARDLGEAASELVQGYGAPPLSVAQVVTMVGDGAPLLVRRALAQSGVDPETPDALDRFLRIYARRSMDHTVAYPGIHEELSRAVRRGPLAVLTNKPLGPAIGLLEALGLRGFFARIIGGDGEYGRKPATAGLNALRALAPDEAVVLIGDSPADAQTAAAAACPFVFARYGFGSVKFAAPPATPFSIDHPRELSAALELIR
jgi:phosphoglycolate phosphatase